MVVMMSDLPEPYGVLYQFAHEYDKDAPETENAAIRILEPKFKNVVIRFNQVQFIEDHITKCRENQLPELKRTFRQPIEQNNLQRQI